MVSFPDSVHNEDVPERRSDGAITRRRNSLMGETDGKTNEVLPQQSWALAI